MKFLKKLIGKKCGMTQLFDSTGKLVPCTVVFVEPNAITQVKTEAVDGYNAIQIGALTASGTQYTQERKIGKPLLGHFKKAGTKLYTRLVESKSPTPITAKAGDQITVEEFKDVTFVDVIGTTKGKGYQGVMKKHGFAGGPASHGSGFHRHAGSTGMRSSPGRSLPNSPRASQMGNVRQTVQNIRIVAVHPEKNIIVLKGQIPGYAGATVVIQEAKKKQ